MSGCQVSGVRSQVSSVRCQVSSVTCHLSHVRCHLSCVACHLSHVTNAYPKINFFPCGIFWTISEVKLKFLIAMFFHCFFLRSLFVLNQFDF